MKHELGTIKVKAEITEENRDTIDSLSDVKAKYRDLGQEQKEHLYAVFLDNGNKEIGDKLIGLGTIDSVQFDPGDIAQTAALVNAGAVILVHNHPSGTATATQKDIDTTQQIHEALELLSVQLLDHVIITRHDSHSMKANSEGPFQSP